MKILGISSYFHDSAAALVIDGNIIAAAQEERFTRIKHDPAFPKNSILYCLKEANCTLEEIDYIVFYEKPFLKFERLIETYLSFAPRGFQSFMRAIPLWIKEKLFQKQNLKEELAAIGTFTDFEKRILFTEHHQSHAASAFYPSPFAEAAVLTMDGVGEWTTTSLAIGQGNKLEIIKELHFPHSLGLLYSAFTFYTGFKVNSGEYKVMGLAPYGKPVYAKLIFDHLVDVKEDGTFRIDQQYFDYCTGLRMTNDKFHNLFGGPPRKAEDLLTQREMDLAASIQYVCEEIVLKLGRSIARETGMKNLCLAGGVALNCVANGKLLRDGCFENIWIQPAAGDAGGALGAALAAYYWHFEKPRVANKNDSMRGAYLGPSFENQDIQNRLTQVKAKFEVLKDDEVAEKTAVALSQGKAIGWFQGRMEFGPRSLGGRSILGDARSPEMQKILNLKVKFRESFRPFAPSVLFEDVNSWFDLNTASPYMLLVADLQEQRKIKMTHEQMKLFGIEKLNILRSEIPAVTHIDYSARIQTVHSETNPKYYELLKKFKEKTGCPVIVNTSFNVRGEPIVCSPEDAFRCLMGTGIEVLMIGNCWVERAAQDLELIQDYKDKFELD